ncbi:MAG TPA: futalosine hydrolase [Desulfosarcina sp.]|nr:futalosine hydrolase [Desulfosarcina sp.]
MRPVLVAAAVTEEAAPLIAAMETPATSSRGGRRITFGRIGPVPAAVIVTGPGMANTVQALTAAIENDRPGLILQTGCAGAFAGVGLAVGDIGIAEREIDAQSGIEADSPGNPPDPLPFPILERDGQRIFRDYPTDPDLCDRALLLLTGAMAPAAVRKGPFVTVATVTATADQAARLQNRFSSIMEAMEGAGAAHVAWHYQIPFLEIRAASNRVGPRDRNAWNLPLAFSRAAEAVCRLIRHMTWNDHRWKIRCNSD